MLYVQGWFSLMMYIQVQWHWDVTTMWPCAALVHCLVHAWWTDTVHMSDNTVHRFVLPALVVWIASYSDWEFCQTVRECRVNDVHLISREPQYKIIQWLWYIVHIIIYVCVQHVDSYSDYWGFCQTVIKWPCEWCSLDLQGNAVNWIANLLYCMCCHCHCRCNMNESHTHN